MESSPPWPPKPPAKIRLQSRLRKRSGTGASISIACSMLPRTIRAVVCAGAVCAGAMMLAAADAPLQTFDVATVRPNRTGKAGGNLAAPAGMLTIRNLPLRTIIGAAYGIAEYQISGPRWLGEERFDIVA